MRTLTYAVDDAVPRMAWCARLGASAREVSVHCGSWIERRGDAFFEGAWSGPFDRGEFDTALTSCASGGKVSGEGTLFSTPTHTNQALYSIAAGDSLWISNSLVFLLHSSGRSLRQSYPYYESDLMSVMFGIDDYRGSVPTDGAEPVRIHYLCNVLVRDDLSLESRARPKPPVFESYEDYVGLLEREVKAMVRNAAAASRAIAYAPLATISKGYDSPACAALVREAGCSDAFTFVRARDGFADQDDNGRQIGEALGLQVAELDAEAAKARRDPVRELEFIGAGFGGDDVVLIAAQELLPRRLLVTGTHGDKIWDMVRLEGGDAILRGDPSGSSLAEFRLRLGFILFPIPFTGATRYTSVVGISVSEAMKPWSLANTRYDRPIPRRILEERGIPRHWFGQAKRAVATPHHGTGRELVPLESVYTAATVDRFSDYCSSASAHAGLATRVVHRVAHATLRSYKAARCLSVLFGVLGRGRAFRYFRWRYSKPLVRENWVFHWAVRELRDRYRSPNG